MKKLLTRTAAGTGFAVLTISALLINQYVFAAYMLFIMVVMMVELFRMSMGTSYRIPRILAYAAGVVMFMLVFLHEAGILPARFIALSVVAVIVLMSSSLFVKDKAEFGKYAFLLSGLLYIALPVTLSNLLVFSNGDFSGIIILCFFIIIWSSDIGAYIFGMALGQRYGRRLCPEISPKKSWIGFWGGLAFSALSALVIRWVGLWDLPVVHCIILGLVMGLGGVLGDLFESMWKRNCGLKDSGNIIPGHGGLLDRFDSSLFAMPIGAIYLTLFNLL